DDLRKSFPGAEFTVVGVDQELAAYRVRMPNGEVQIFARAGYTGYRDAWARGVGLDKVPDHYQVDHVYPENSALGYSKEAFQDQLKAWRDGGMRGARPTARNYEWLRIEAVHEDVNGQVGRIWEQRTSRLRTSALTAPVRRASYFERLKLD